MEIEYDLSYDENKTLNKLPKLYKLFQESFRQSQLYSFCHPHSTPNTPPPPSPQKFEICQSFHWSEIRQMDLQCSD